MLKNIQTPVFRIAIAVLVIFTAASCSTVRVEKPVESYQPSVFKPKPSVIGFTTEARISDIQKEVNRAFTGLVYEDNSLDDNGGDNLMVKAWKQGDITLSMKENMISYRVPLKLWIKAGFKVEKLGITLSDYREVNGALALKFKTALTLNPDWSVSSKTEPDGYEWLSDPVVKVAGMNIPVKFVADLILQSNLKTMGKTIDESVKEYFDLKSYALEAWKTLNQPVSLNEEYSIWLSIQPAGFSANQIIASNGIIRHLSGMESVIETRVGPKPAMKTPGPLPKLRIDNNIDDKVMINLSVDIPFTEINTQAGRYLNGQTFSEGKRKVKIENVKIYGSHGKMVAETTLSGSLRGTIYFSGIPAFNASDSTLYIKDFDFDISTRNFLVKSAAWIYQGGFRNMIAKQMVWPLAPEMRFYKSEINRMLKSYPLAEGVSLNGQFNHLMVNDIVLSQDGIKPLISAEGKLKVVFGPAGGRK